MLVQKMLRTGTTLDDLASSLFIKSRRHKDHQNLVLLKYDQIQSPMANPVVQECRGVILDESRDWEVVSRSFDKFFNYGEANAAEIDWNTARVQEKLDGSLCVLYWYGGCWNVQTSGSPDAGGSVDSSPGTFADLFWETFNNSYMELPESSTELDRDMCWAFELSTSRNRIVVVHDEPSLTLIGVRHRRSGAQYTTRIPDLYYSNWKMVKEFPLQSFDDISKTFETMNPLAQEGYVVVDGNFNRVKVKHPGYVALHHAKDGMTDRALLEIARNGEVSEVVAHFPELADKLREIEWKLSVFVAGCHRAYGENMHHESQKDFANAVKGHVASSVLFNCRKGQRISDTLKNVSIYKLEEWLGLSGN